MGNRLSRGSLRRAALMTMCVGAGACAVPAASSAASITPASFTSCWGSLTPGSGAKKAKEPGLLNYSFTCNGGIFAYTIIAYQGGDDGAAIQDFDPSPMVFEADNRTPSPTETVTCEGAQPSNGVNCNTGTYLSEITGGYYVSGTIDLGQSYCKHFPAPARGKTLRPGTPAIQTARVQLVVTDWSGAQDGPFALREPIACRAVPDRVPEPARASTKPSTRQTSRSSKKTKTSPRKHTTDASKRSAR